MLSTSLRGVVSQQLLKKADGNGRVAALEILINTRLREPDSSRQIRSVGKHHADRRPIRHAHMDSAIQALFDAGTVSGAEAYKKAINKAKFEAFKAQL